MCLIVDDEHRLGQRLKDHFADLAHLGVISVSSLDEAAEVLDSGRYEINCLITDWSFDDAGTKQSRFEDGFDLIDYAKLRYPALPVYLMTAHKHEENLLEGLKKYPDLKVFQKQEIQWEDTKKSRQTPGDGNEQPWNVINMDLERARRSGAKSSRSKHEPMGAFRTLLQRLPKLVVRKPIVVSIVGEGGEFTAFSDEIGLLMDARGSSPHKALAELSVIIADHFFTLEEMNDLEGYAHLVRENLRQYISQPEEKNDQTCQAL